MDSEFDVCNFKFLTLYRDDFDSHSIIVHGGAFHKAFPVLPFEESFRLSVNRVVERICGWKGNPNLLRIAAGELVKLLLAWEGYRGPWDKFSVLKELERRGYSKLAGFWRAYISGDNVGFEKVAEAARLAASMLGLGLECLG
jgi:hypothetical protein